MRTVEVPVRVEQLVVEHEPLDPLTTSTAAVEQGGGASRHLEIVLREEVPVVTLDVRPVEVVRVDVRTVRGEEVVEADLRTEHVVVEGAEPRASERTAPPA